MLAIPVDTSSQAPYRSFPCRHEKSLTSLLLLFPKSLATFREPCVTGLLFCAADFFHTCLYPPKRKSYVPAPPFWIWFLPLISDIQKSRHTTSRMAGGFPSCPISQCYVTALKFKTFAAYTNREKQHTPRLRSALCHRLTFKQIALCDFQFSSNSLSGILEYHSGDMAVKILHKLLVYPVDRDFIHLP